MMSEMNKLPENLKFIESIHGASVGVTEEVVTFSDYSLPENTPNPPGFVRGVANLYIDNEDKEVILRVYIRIEELRTNLQIWVFKGTSKGWVNLESNELEETHGHWGGYLEVSGYKEGDPSIAVGR